LELARCLGPEGVARCSTRVLLEPRLPAALLTREALPASIPGTMRELRCSFFCPLPAIQFLFRDKTHKDTTMIAQMFKDAQEEILESSVSK
jgi:hypothetical protein